MDVRLYTIKVRVVFRSKMDNIVNILPQVMIMIYVLIESTFTILIKHEFLNITNIAPVFHVVIVDALFISQTSEGVYNNTEDNIETNNVNYDLESSIMN